MICGIDEAGRGPVMGPMVVAGVAVSGHRDEDSLFSMGVKDSKRLTPDRRHTLAREIRALHRVHTIVVPAEDIDAMREQMTMNELEVTLFTTVAKALACDEVYVDSADVNEGRFGSSILKGLAPGTRMVSKHRADDTYPVVSAASIVAKSLRDSEMERIDGELGGGVGSGYPSDPVTVRFMKNYIASNGELPPHTRKSWETARRMLAESAQTRLG